MTYGKFFAILILLMALAMGVHVLVALLWGNYALDSTLLQANLASLLFLTLKTAAAYRVTTRGLSLSAWRFVNVVSGVMLLKMMLSIGWVVVMVFAVKVEALGFALPYFGGYILLTAFEITALLNNLRPDSQKSPE